MIPTDCCDRSADDARSAGCGVVRGPADPPQPARPSTVAAAANIWSVLRFIRRVSQKSRPKSVQGARAPYQAGLAGAAVAALFDEAAPIDHADERERQHNQEQRDCI